MDMNAFKNLAIVAILCGTAFVLYRNREKLLVVFSGKRMDVSKKRRTPSLSNAMQEVCKAFLGYADNFQGLYEPLYKAARGTISQERKSNVLTEWNIRMNNISQPPIGLKSWWGTIVADWATLSDHQLQERAAQILEMIKACGIVRDDRNMLTAKSDTTLYYQNSEGKTWSVGQELVVESPCWYVQSNPVRIIEKGYCEIK